MTREQKEKGEMIAGLINGYRLGNLNESEKNILDTWINASPANKALFDKLLNEQYTGGELKWADELEGRDLSGIFQRTSPVRRIVIKGLVAAASLLVIFSAITLVIYKNNAPKQETVSIAPVQPGSATATLTSSNGETIDLGKIKKETIKIDDKSQAIVYNSILIYSSGSDEAIMHTLSTPAGGEYQVVLSDGTKVWLNAESEIQYPAAFNESVREVVAEGELYFEVAKGTQPFVVKTGNTSIKVTGTKFNVHAYSGEARQIISLVEGKVELRTTGSIIPMVANQEVVITEQEAKIVMNPDIHESISWTKGLFSFRKTPIEEVMRQVSRWYNVKVTYEQKIDKQFTGRIRRNSSLDEVVKMLQLSGDLRLEIRGREIFMRYN